MRWKKVTLLGVGLLGGSLGLALKQRRLAKHVAGYVRRESSIEECLKAGAVDSATLDLLEAVRGADLIVFCTPIAQMLPLARRIGPHLTRGALVTDVGSVKGSVVKRLEKVFAKTRADFVGSHPMAGAEKMGVSSASAGLFEGAVCVITPTGASSDKSVDKLQALWKSVGCRCLLLSPSLHDQLVSRSSHLPHVVAAELVNHVLNPELGTDQAALCANGFRDSTRIASGSPEMWRDIVLANRAHLGRALDGFIADLSGFRRALAIGDEERIRRFFERAKELRDVWASRPRASSPE